MSKPVMFALVSCIGAMGCGSDFIGSGGAGSTGSTGTMPTSSSTGLPNDCDPSKLMPGQSLASTCGVFVEPGKTAGNGTQGSPFGTLAEATAATQTKPIFVCSTGATLDESATLTGGAQLVGALTCGTWQVSSTKTPWTAPANTSPLVLTAPTNALIQGFAITARDATGSDAATLQGHSSIGVVVDGGTATLADIDIVAGKGAAGGDGMSETGQAPGRQGTASDFDGNMGGACAVTTAGQAKDFTCPDGAMTKGGVGGLGDTGNGLSGGPGLPALGSGAAGNGDSGAGGWDCGTNGGNGGFGHSGPSGNPGPKGSGLGTLTSASLYQGAAGGPGEAGQPAQGGGGGGGFRGGLAGGCSVGVKGPSGGSGGAGGCGGLAHQAPIACSTLRGASVRASSRARVRVATCANETRCQRFCARDALTISLAGGGDSGGLGGTNGVVQATSGADGPAAALRAVSAR